MGRMNFCAVASFSFEVVRIDQRLGGFCCEFVGELRAPRPFGVQRLTFFPAWALTRYPIRTT
jgi:hypothetical protein